MTLKPRALFNPKDPETVISVSERESAFRKYYSPSEVRASLWRSYGESLLCAAEISLEANDGAVGILKELFLYPIADEVDVKAIRGDIFELTCKDTKLYLVDTEEGEAFLSFFSPWSIRFKDEMSRLDLTGYGNKDAGYFLAVLFESLDAIAHYMTSFRLAV